MNKEKQFFKKFLNYINLEFKKVLVILLVFLSIVIAVLHSAYVNVGEMENQLKQNLEDVAKQNALVLKSKINAQFELLNSLSKELSGITKETISDKLDEFKIFIGDYNLKRFAYSFPDGITYSTDGDVTDLSYREFFKRGMKGQCYITGVLNDALKEEHSQVNVMTIPIYGENDEITGVFGVAYDTLDFNESMQIESFDGQGYSCIINGDGEIVMVMGENSLELSQNIFDGIVEADIRNKQTVEELKTQIENQEDGSGILYMSGENYYCCVPVELMGGCLTWHIITILPSEVLSQRVAPIQLNQYVTSMLVGILVVIGAVIIIVLLKRHHREMLHAAYEDSLTNGPNFAKFSLDMKNRTKSPGWLISMNITNFNNVMIAVGENAAYTMVKETWKIINSLLQRDELACHIKDDMFLLFLKAADEDSLVLRMEQASQKISELVKEFRVYGIQAGYGIYPMSGEETIDNAYSKAKLASEYVAMNSKVHYAFYNEENRVKMQQEKQLEEHFPEALEKQEFEVWYQPKYSVADGAVVGSEALVRWRKEDGQLISPGIFIPLFEGNGMIADLDEYMFRTVCNQQKQWMDEGKKIYPVSINISRASLYSIDLAKRYSKIMEEAGISSEYIQVEVTESAIGGKTDIYKILNKFRKMGIKILMDDFGTGYSSLATLSTQCFDTLKLDKSLIDHIGSKEGEILLCHIIEMGQQMKLHITAEGVESRLQVEFLQHVKCDDIQGFYFSKPLPKDEYEKILTEKQ